MTEKFDHKYVKFAKSLDSKINDTGGFENTYLYRGISDDTIPEVIKFSSGVLVNKAYTSTTKLLDVAKKYVSDKGCCILMFTIPSNIKYAELPDQDWEHEVLLERNTQFVIDIEASNHPIYIATLSKWEPPKPIEDVKTFVKSVADILREKCQELGKDKFYELRKAEYLKDHELDDAEFLAESDVDDYCK
jgi:hypothetical protein